MSSLPDYTHPLAYFINQATNIANFSNNNSLVDVTKIARVEPLCLISKDLINLEELLDVNQSLLTLFSAYYLQAVSVLTTLKDVSIIKTLDKLNPNRDKTAFLLAGESREDVLANLVMENYKYQLPTSSSVCLELDKPENSADQLTAVSNLSIGKLLNVEFLYETEKDGESKTIKIPISIRLMTSVLQDSNIEELLIYDKEDKSLKERYHKWRSGRLGFIKDLILCQDIIDQYKRTAIGDDSGTFSEIIRRVNNSKKYGILTKNPSMVSASNIFVISEVIAKKIESKLHIKLSKFKDRNKLFENTYAMIIVVVDREWEMATFYTRGIEASTEHGFKSLKNINKSKSSSDVKEVLKSLQSGMGAAF